MVKITALHFYRIRRYYGLTLKQMADVLGVSESYVHAIEVGREPVTDAMQKRVNTAFSLTTNRLRAITIHYREHIEPFDRYKGSKTLKPR